MKRKKKGRERKRVREKETERRKRAVRNLFLFPRDRRVNTVKGTRGGRDGRNGGRGEKEEEALNRLHVFLPSFILFRFHFPTTLESRPVREIASQSKFTRCFDL